MSSDLDTTLVTVDDILAALREREELTARLSDVERKIQGIRAFIGEARFSAISPISTGAADAPATPPSFRSVLQEALENAPRGLTYPELREILIDAGFGERLENSPNNFFNAIGRLLSQNKAVKRGGRVFWMNFYEALSDDELSALDGHDQAHTTPEAIIATLKEASGPLKAAEVIDIMVQTHSYIKATAIYAALSRLTKDRTLKRDEHSRYSVA
ncbi:hypothetical protein [Brevundimonas sp. TSRC1-1]|uniref:hypothetical protein n=1 Tax=Brevundimonas sp. TSRC1-1 TaxID=2804562 RepID=UPI003CE79C83